MKQMTRNEIKVLIIQFEMHMKSSFVSDFLSHNFFTARHVIRLNDSAKHALLRLFDKSDDEHLEHVVGFHLFETVLFHEFV